MNGFVGCVTLKTGRLENMGKNLKNLIKVIKNLKKPGILIGKMNGNPINQHTISFKKTRFFINPSLQTFSFSNLPNIEQKKYLFVLHTSYAWFSHSKFT